MLPGRGPAKEGEQGEQVLPLIDINTIILSHGGQARSLRAVISCMFHWFKRLKIADEV